MAATNFKTENNTFRKLLGNGLTYRIPPFQRDYSWGEEEWEDLWQDLLGTLGEGGEVAHYMGYLVLQSGDDRAFDVIDGQQRLTTISVLVLAVLKNLQRLVEGGIDADANRRRIEQISGSYLGFTDPVTLVSKTKLTLNRNNNSYWQNHLVALGHLPTRGFRASEHLLRRAFEWFDAHVRAHVPTHGDRGRALAQFMEDASDRLFFTVITVTDELNAYKVFETLNARGVRLSATDLLKNWLFSLLARGASPHEIASLEDRWEAMIGRLGAESFPDFLRVHWNSRREFARQAGLFKTIRARVLDRAAVFDLVRQMEEDLDHYLALVSPEGSVWPMEAKEHVQTLRTFHVARPFSMLIAARRRFADDVFTDLLRDCVVLAFRANVICGFSAGEQERVFSEVALGIANGEVRSRAEVLDRLRTVYPGDQTFRAAFVEKVIRTTQSRNNRVVRYLLCRLERHVSGNAELLQQSESFNVEHVLPQNPGPAWGAIPETDAESLTYRLGNTTLLRKAANSDVGNGSWAEKRAVLAASEFAIARRLAAVQDWNAEAIAANQVWMATQAVAIWRIDRLS
jgi:hypothetical protein